MDEAFRCVLGRPSVAAGGVSSGLMSRTPPPIALAMNFMTNVTPAIAQAKPRSKEPQSENGTSSTALGSSVAPASTTQNMRAALTTAPDTRHQRINGTWGLRTIGLMLIRAKISAPTSQTGKRNHHGGTDSNVNGVLKPWRGFPVSASVP